jgi:outer membrane protein
MIKHLPILGLCSLGFMAQAQTDNTWMIQVGAIRISPNVSSGSLSAPAPAGSTVDVGNDTRASLQLTYVHNDHFSVAIPLGTGFRHKLFGDGEIANVGHIGTVSALPISVFGQYRLGVPDATIRPYAMLGLSYVKFRDAEGSAALNALNPINPIGGSTQLSVGSRWAFSPGLGVTVWLNDQWFLDASWARTYLKTTTTLSTGQTIDTKLNPDVTTVGLGMKF